MHLNKTLFSLMVIIIFFTGCISLKQKVVSKPAEVVATSIEIKHGKFDSFLEELKYDCDIHLVEESDTYLQFVFGAQNDFDPHSFKLIAETKKKLKCITPIILNNRNFIVQIVGHANDSISMSHNRHLANNRAIVAAELLYKDGIDDIYAKGCPEKKLMTHEIDRYNMFVDSSVSIYVYNKETDVKNPCP